MKVKIKSTVEDVRIVTIFLYNFINQFNTSTFNEAIIIHIINAKKLRDKLLLWSENSSHKKLKTKCSISIDINQLKSLIWALSAAKQLNPTDIVTSKDKYLLLIAININNQYQEALQNVYKFNIL
jgi:hypothetical protein